MTLDHPFHAGELRVQERLGESREAGHNGRAISDTIVRGAFRFVAEQPFVVLASVEAATGATWASLVGGTPGFARVPDERSLELDLSRMALAPGDPWLANLDRDPRLGTLFIEPGSRRRLRINGRAERHGDLLRVAVDEAFPNCPKYIQRRHLRTSLDDGGGGAVTEGVGLDAEAEALIRGADTFFIASGNPDGSLDASHRGGEPGFVSILEDGTLEVPDYPGNHMYNTLGNLEVNPRAGLVFLDFTSGRTLQLTGTAEVVWEPAGRLEATGGTDRFWRFTPERRRSFPAALRMEWEFLDASPTNPPV